MNLKSISSFIASILLIGFTISTGIIIYYFFTTFPRTQMQEASGLTSKVLSCAGAMFEIKVKGCNLMNGLVLWLPMDEGEGTIVYDYSGYGNNGNLYNGTNACSNPPTEGCPTWVDGVLGKALSFDGVDDYVIVPNSPTLNPSKEVSVITWALFNILSDDKGAIDLIGKTLWWGGAFELQYFGDDIYFKIFNFTSSDLARVNNYLITDRWYFVAGTYNSNNGIINLYINGTLLAYKSSGGQINISTSNIAIGRNPAAGYFHNGTIDEVLIYNRALSEEEIKKLYYNSLENKFNITIGLLNNGYADLGNSFTAIVYLKNGTILQFPINFERSLNKGNYFEYNLTVDGYYPSYGLVDKLIVCSNDCQGVCSEVRVNNKC